MTLRKRLLAVFAVICVAAGVIYVGISGIQVPEKETEHRFTFGNKETIYFWYSDESLTDYVNSAAVAFGEKENVRVIPVLTGDSEYLEAINKASITGEQIPDVYLLGNDSLEKAYLAGLAAEIQDNGEVCNEQNFPKSALLAVTYKGKLVAYPYYYETSAFVYNRTYMDEWAKQQMEQAEEEVEPDWEAEGVEIDTTVSGGDGSEMEGTELTTEERLEAMVEGGIPATVDEVLAFADNYAAPEIVEAVFKWDVSDIFYNYHFAGAGLVVGGEAGDDKNQISILNEETVQCLEIYKNLNQFFYIEADTVTYESVLTDFIEGKLVFTIATTDVVKKLADAKADGSFAYEYGIAPLPEPSAQLKGRGLSVTTVAVVNGYSAHKETANRFAAFLTGEYLENLFAITGKVSSCYHANQDNEYLKAFMTEYENSSSLPKMIETSNYWIQLEIMFSKIWGGADVTEQLNFLAQQIQSQIQGNHI